MNNYTAIKWITWKKMERFLEKFNLPRLNQEEIEIMNNPVTSNEIEAVIKNLQRKTQKPGTRWLYMRIYQTFREELMPVLLKLFQKFAEDGNTFKLILRGHHHPDTKTNDKTKKENYRPISLMNIDRKILNKILANRIHNTSKSSSIMIKLGLFHGCKIYSTYANQSM